MLYAFTLGRKLRGEDLLILKKAVKVAQIKAQSMQQKRKSMPQTCKTSSSIPS
ncbi:terminase [Salmonella phage 22]|uniref:Terminase n=1 Tax=Salmonella phage 22 TaxID=1654885 RepID=A0A0N7CGE1_BPP22|nr:terminase [Salmonella phage 22]